MASDVKLKLSWDQTKDSVLFDIINHDVACWFVEQSLMHGNNRYELGDQIVDQLRRSHNSLSLIDEEIEYINTVNTVLKKLKIPQFTMPTDWFDQQQLNKLHKEWALTRYSIPNLSQLLYKLDRKYFEAYQEMNCHIHFIENSFRYSFRDLTHWRVNNPFQNTYYPWQVCHLYIEYPGHGRNAFEQFENYDDGEDWDQDSINWDNIDALLGMNLVRPYSIEPPKQFVEWCQQKKLVPHRSTIPLGNVTNWQNQLASARKIFTENVIIQNNYFSLEIIK